MARTITQVLIITIFICKALIVTVYAQNKMDSLRSALSYAENEGRVDILFHLSMELQHSDPDSAMYYAEIALNEAKILNYAKGQADALINMGRLKRDKGDYSEALEDIFASLTIYKYTLDSIQIGNALNDISIIYAYSEDYEQSLNFFEQALDIFTNMGDEKGESQALNNIGLIHLELGHYKQAEEYMLRSLAIKIRRNDTKDISTGYANLGSIMEEIDNDDKAIKYYMKADALFIQTNNKTGLASNNLAIANLYKKKGFINEAHHYALNSYEIARSINSKPFMQSATKTLVEIAEFSEDYRMAFKYQKLNSEVKDSLYNESSKRHLEELKAQINAEEQKREIRLLKKDQELQNVIIKQKDTLAFSLAGGIAFSLIILLLVFIAYRGNKKKKEILAEKNREIHLQREDLIKTNRDKDQLFSIISHDIRGPLSTLKGFSTLLINHIDQLSKENIKEMGTKINLSLENLNELLDNLLAWSLSQSKQNGLKIEKINIHELVMKNLELYELTASTKQVRLVNKCDAGIEAQADYNSIHTVLRNLISNAIKFSYPKSDITISAEYIGGQVKISVADQGIGMNKDVMSKLFDMNNKKSMNGTSDEKGSGFGLVLCHELIKKNQGTLTVESEVRNGSKIMFTIPA